MSWLIGAWSDQLPADVATHLSTIHSSPLHTFGSDHLYLACGGIDETCVVETSGEAGDEGWLVVGTPIVVRGDVRTFARTIDLASIVTAHADRLDELDGHFVALRFGRGGVELRNDRLGMRTAHVALHRGVVYFSTRLDWLSRAIGGASLRVGAFGAYWLLYNQMTTRSLLDGVERLGQGGRIRADAREIEAASRPWLPRPVEVDRLESSLSSIVGMSMPDRFAPSLALSGGLDSRLLLALMASRVDLQLHTIGDRRDADVATAETLAAVVGKRILRIDEPLPDAGEALRLLQQYSSAASAVEPATTIGKLRYSSMLRSAGRVVFDGGMGEIARRQFMKRVRYGGGSAIVRRNAPELVDRLRLHRGRFFRRDLLVEMERGAVSEMEMVLSELPAWDLENLIDLLIVRTRYPNVAGVEQGRADAEAVTIMPFAQPTVLDAVFATSLGERRGGRLVRRMIERHRSALARIPLVKNHLAYPYRLGPLGAWAWTAARKRIAGGYDDQTRWGMLSALSSAVEELAGSDDTRGCGFYDMGEIDRMASRLRAGDRAVMGELDWWLAFEFWRRGSALHLG